MDTYAIAPAPIGSDAFVELSANGAKYRIFEKHILNMGPLNYNGRVVSIDDDFYTHLVTNLERGVCVPSVPKVNAQNQHVEDPDLNIGKVIGLSRRDGKIYARFEARDEEAANKIGKSYLGASAFFHLNYQDTATTQRVGPTLLHVAVTNRPYVTNLEDYNEVLLSRGADSNDEAVVLTAATKETDKMTLEELYTALKVDHDIDVPDLQKRAKTADAAVALTSKIRADLISAELVALSADQSEDDVLNSYDDIKGAIDAAHDEIVSLSAQVQEMTEAQAREEAEAKVQKLVDDAFIAEDKVKAYVKLALNDPETFDDIVPGAPIVALSNEDGTSEDTNASEPTTEDLDKEAIDRITSYEGFNFNA